MVQVTNKLFGAGGPEPESSRTEQALEYRVLRHLWVIEQATGSRARADRERAIEHVLAIFRGRGRRG